jgi:hypothetical protein
VYNTPQRKHYRTMVAEMVSSWRYWQYYFWVPAEAIHSKTPIFFLKTVVLFFF